MNLSLIAILFAVGANAGTDHARIKKAVWTGLDSVPCRNAASHGGKVDGMLPAYGEVDVLCQQTGDNYGPGVKNKIWDYTHFGCYVHNYLLEGPVFRPAVPWCKDFF